MSALVMAPHAPEAEISVLGGMLIDPEAARTALGMLGDGSCFYRETHRRIYRAMVTVAASGSAVDPTTLTEQLRAAGDLEATGGIRYVAELLDDVPTAANIEYHARIVLDRAARRALIEASQEAAELAATEGADAAAARLRERLAELERHTRGGGPEVRTLADILADPHALDAPPEVVPGLPLAWGGRATLLAAREKDGKSTLAGYLIARASWAGPVLVLALEEHPADLAARLVRFGANPANVFILDRLQSPLADFAAAVERVRPVLVVVDTLAAFAGLMPEPPAPGDSTAWTPIMAGLTLPVRDTGAGLLLLAHARKSDGHYRDSTAIGANVDAILEMEPVQGNPAARRIKAKARWTLDDFTLSLVGDRYELDGPGLSLDARVLAFVVANPGCSTRLLRAGIAAKATDVDAALAGLLQRGAVVDRGDGRGRSLHPGAGVCPEPGHGASPGHAEIEEHPDPEKPAWTRDGHAPDTVRDTAPPEGVSPFQTHKGWTRDTQATEEPASTDGLHLCAAGCGQSVGAPGITCAKCASLGKVA